MIAQVLLKFFSRTNIYLVFAVLYTLFSVTPDESSKNASISGWMGPSGAAVASKFLRHSALTRSSSWRKEITAPRAKPTRERGCI